MHLNTALRLSWPWLCGPKEVSQSVTRVYIYVIYNIYAHILLPPPPPPAERWCDWKVQRGGTLLHVDCEITLISELLYTLLVSLLIKLGQLIPQDQEVDFSGLWVKCVHFPLLCILKQLLTNRRGLFESEQSIRSCSRSCYVFLMSLQRCRRGTWLAGLKTNTDKKGLRTQAFRHRKWSYRVGIFIFPMLSLRVCVPSWLPTLTWGRY